MVKKTRRSIPSKQIDEFETVFRIKIRVFNLSQFYPAYRSIFTPVSRPLKKIKDSLSRVSQIFILRFIVSNF